MIEIEQLDDARRERVGRAWLWRMEQEHLAVSTFSRLAIELAELGCQPVVLELCTKAAADEVRHSVICRDIARAFLGDRVPAFVRGARAADPRSGATREQALAIDIAETCCISETLTVAYFTRMVDVAREPFRGMVRELLADEIDHGRLGWAYLNELRARGIALDHVTEALPALLERQVADVLGSAEEDDPALDQFGYLGPQAAAAVYRSGLADIVMPGFEAVGIDTTTVRRLVTERGWI